jgi:hypothetical protein
MFNSEARSIKWLPLALVLAVTLFFVPGLSSQAFAKEVFAEQAFAEEAFAKEVLAEEEGAEEGGEPKVEWSQDVFYKQLRVCSQPNVALDGESAASLFR